MNLYHCGSYWALCQGHAPHGVPLLTRAAQTSRLDFFDCSEVPGVEETVRKEVGSAHQQEALYSRLSAVDFHSPAGSGEAVFGLPADCTKRRR